MKYYRTTDKRWFNQQDVGLAVAPSTWPEDAEKGKKWIEISITNQTLVLWEGKKPVYATLVSTGQAGLDDPKKTTATIRGSFHIRNKHISAMMDSNESSSRRRPGQHHGGRDAPQPTSGDGEADRRRQGQGPRSKTARPRATRAKPDKGAKAEDRRATPRPRAAPAEKPIPEAGDGDYGVTRRRGEGTFQLQATCRTSSTSRAATRSTPPTGTTCSARRAATAASTSRRSTRTASSSGPIRRCPKGGTR